MKTWKKIALGGAAVALASLAAFAIHKAGLACENVNKRAAMKIFDANGCIEFWLNRYQSAWSGVIGASAALAAAYAAWRAVQQQIALQGYAHAQGEVVRLAEQRRLDMLAFVRVQNLKLALIALRDMIAANDSPLRHSLALDRYLAIGNAGIPRLHLSEISPVLDVDDDIARVENIYRRNMDNQAAAAPTLERAFNHLLCWLEPLDAEQNRISARIKATSEKIESLNRHLTPASA